MNITLLQQYEQQNPEKYLRKYGEVIKKSPDGQPIQWRYRSPEEVMTGKIPTPVPVVAGIEKKNEIELEFNSATPIIDPISGFSAEQTTEQPKAKRLKKIKE